MYNFRNIQHVFKKNRVCPNTTTKTIEITCCVINSGQLINTVNSPKILNICNVNDNSWMLYQFDLL